MHVRIQLAGPAVAGLHLIHDEKGPVFGRKTRRTPHIFRVQLTDAAFALHHLHHNRRAAVLCEQAFQIGEIVRFRVYEAGVRG